MGAARTFVLAALALAACTPAPPKEAGTPSPPPPCEANATRTLAFTGADAQDTLEARTTGPDCASAIVTVTVRQQDGAPAMTFAVPLSGLRSDLDLAKPVAPEAVTAFLKTYVAEAQLDVGGAQLPEWKANSPGPGFDQGQELTSPLDRETYEQLRKAKPNMLCMVEAREGSTCHVWDAKNSRGLVIVQNG